MATAAESGFRESTDVPTGRLGMWWFVASEIVIFGGLLGGYLLLLFGRLRRSGAGHA